jgi:AcrR family transcriptional regulator
MYSGNNPETPEHPVVHARARRSRDALQQALLRLLQTHSLEGISTRDIAAEAGVGHATFYRHYSDKGELLDAVATDQMDRLISLSLSALGTGDAGAASRVLCRYVHDHWSVWSALLTGGAAAAMKAELLALTRDIASDWKPVPHKLPPDLGNALSTAMVIEILVWWLQQAEPLPVERVAAIFAEVVVAPLIREGTGAVSAPTR